MYIDNLICSSCHPPADTPRCFKMGMWYEGYGKCTEIGGKLS